ncbi:AMP-binding protein [Sphingopyxis alaskensis]|uniref:AMP-binding protein n=1 Tax=Sphingopyxis alaskensis TaxID=117207 RepID=UPI00203DC02D|nr:AMP-binding protein [Sphingopyxis alaskensis]MCM3419776.1 AMP-binding protein [Sphingopyxis alaskensis]
MSEPRTLLRMVQDAAAKSDAKRLIFVHSDDSQIVEEKRSHADLLAAGARIAAAMKQEGMGAGDRFAIILRNHPEFVEAMVGSEIAGTVFVPIDPRMRGDKLAYMLRFSGAKGAIVSADVLPNVEALLPDLPELRWIWVIHAGESDPRALHRILASVDPVVELVPQPLDAPMQLLFTSGTTGDPKAIQSPYARFSGVASLGAVIGLRPDDIVYTGLSLTHANAQLISLGNAIAHDLEIVISRQFTKSRLWEILSRYGCTTFNLLGGMATAIFSEPPGPFDRAHKVRFVLSAGMPESMWHDFARRFGVEIFEFFGAAEGGLTLNPPGAGPVGSIGKPPPGSVCEILGMDDSILGPGQQGEICFRGEDGSVAPIHYLDNPEASAAKTRGGWFRTGDVGYKDAEGWLYFCHRDGQSIRRNGDFIDPRVIETALSEMEGVSDVYVYGAATRQNTPGEKEVVAAIVPKGKVEAAALIGRCAERLGSASTPSVIQIVDEIPKTASEKPQERYLIAMLGTPDAQLFDRRGPTRLELKERTTP